MKALLIIAVVIFGIYSLFTMPAMELGVFAILYYLMSINDKLDRK